MASFKVNLLIAFIICVIVNADAALIKPRIAGGSDAEPNQFRYMAGIATQTDFFQWFICGGAIISERHILTAASVVKDYVERPKKLTAVLGSPSYGPNEEVYVVHIEKVILHSEFNNKHLSNDLAILITKENMIFTEAIQPIALPSADLTDENGLKAVVSGWGLLKQPESLSDMAPGSKQQHLTTETLKFNDCVAAYVNELSKSDDWADINPRFSDSKKFCTANPKGEGICVGDAGSPLVADDTLIGIASWSPYCALGLPDVYTNVHAHLDWIHRQLVA